MAYSCYPQDVTNAWRAVWRERCPRCREGPIFKGRLWRGSMAMHERCPVCGWEYQREPGYFVMSLYFSYAISIPPCLAIMLALWRWSKLGFDTIMVCTFLAYLPFVALAVRWARTLWMHMDWYFDPGEPISGPGQSHE